MIKGLGGVFKLDVVDARANCEIESHIENHVWFFLFLALIRKKRISHSFTVLDLIFTKPTSATRILENTNM